MNIDRKQLAAVLIERVNAISNPGGLVAWRQKLKLTQRQAALELDYAPNSLIKYERDPDKAPLHLLYVCAILELLGDERPSPLNPLITPRQEFGAGQVAETRSKVEKKNERTSRNARSRNDILRSFVGGS